MLSGKGGRRERVATGLWAVVALSLIPAPAIRAQRQSLEPTRQQVAETLSRYMHGERPLATVPAWNPKAVAGEMDSFADDYLRSAEFLPNTAHHLLAAFALDFAWGRLADSQPVDVLELVEWGRRASIHRAPRDDFDDAWYLASVGIIESLLDPEGLERHLRMAAPGLKQHAAVRFAGAFALEERLLAAAGARTDILSASARASSPDVQRALDASVKAYVTLKDDPEFGFRSRVRLGRLYLLARRYQDARDVLAPVLATPQTASLAYLSMLLQGKALEGLGLRGEAIVSYRAALTRVNATSARLALSAALFRDGQGPEAAGLAEVVLEGSDASHDPWDDYWIWDLASTPAALSAMRKLLK